MQLLELALLVLGPSVTPLLAAQHAGLEEGEPLFDLELPAIDGTRSLRLSELRGTKLLLIQFASW